jgi:Protein of unknown function (DUF3318)
LLCVYGCIAMPKIVIDREIERLNCLVPSQLRDAIAIAIDPIVGNDRAIAVQRIDRHRCQIQIDPRRWHSLSIDLRNLLFWHEIAKIENGSIWSDRSMYIALGAGLGIASIDLFAQNIGLLATSLLVAGLAGFRLYQKHLGEENLRRLTAADRGAIELAVEFGYERSIARELLQLAIQTTYRQTQNRFSRDRNATRMQVLSLTSDNYQKT